MGWLIWFGFGLLIWCLASLVFALVWVGIMEERNRNRDEAERRRRER